MTENRFAINDFLTKVQLRALKHAEFATGNRDEALDIVQDSMLKLAQKYSNKPESWPKLFQKILHNSIRDWYRKKKVRRILLWWDQEQVSDQDISANHGQTMDNCVSYDNSVSPEVQASGMQIEDKVIQALQQLPERQQQTFLLRAWWGNNVEETALIMGCSSGSVKTHYFRAVAKLKEILGEGL